VLTLSDKTNVKSDPMLPILDLELLSGYMESLGHNFVEKMFNLYKQQVVLYLSAIESAQTNDSTTLWEESCHKMKGASASVGLLKLHSMLVILEKTEASQSEKATLFNDLKIENEKGVTEFQQWLSQKDD
jgi:HPt (histidine-containing phosphotransfer) domain-containing protein